jgi:predicted nucleic acid-binding protein
MGDANAIALAIDLQCDRSCILKNLTHPQTNRRGAAIMQIMAIAQPMTEKNSPLSEFCRISSVGF